MYVGSLEASDGSQAFKRGRKGVQIDDTENTRLILHRS